MIKYNMNLRARITWVWVKISIKSECILWDIPFPEKGNRVMEVVKLIQNITIAKVIWIASTRTGGSVSQW